MLFTRGVPKEDGFYWATHIWVYAGPEAVRHDFAPFLVKVVHLTENDLENDIVNNIMHEEDVAITDAFNFNEGDEEFSPKFLMFGERIDIPKVDNEMEIISTKLHTKFVLK